jgi:Domain of unknown function DUF29
MPKTLYGADFDPGAHQQASTLWLQDWASLDLEHLAAEREELCETEWRGIRSQPRLLLGYRPQ